MENHLQTFSDSPLSFNMIAIEGNRNGDPFKMNDTYRVRLDDFWMGEYPVTQDLWAYVMSDTDIADPSYFKGVNRPVERVSWEDIVKEFLPRLNSMTGLKYQYRLPTEAEWEYAAQGGKYWWQYPFEYAGSNKLEEVGWYFENSHQETQIVGLKTPNLLGLYDMSGNVWEWCSDRYAGDFYEKSSMAAISVNPTGPTTGAYRVFRGGSCFNFPRGCRSTSRISDSHTDRYCVGFRMVLSFSPVQ